MKIPRLNQARQRLDDAFDKIAAFGHDPELQALWAQYLCILVSGFVETGVREVFIEFTKAKAEPRVVNFVEGKIREFQNPKMEKILDIVRQFSPTWEAELRDKTAGEIKDAIDSVVANRHALAHGKSVGVTFTRIKEWYGKSVKFIRIVGNTVRHSIAHHSLLRGRRLPLPIGWWSRTSVFSRSRATWV